MSLPSLARIPAPPDPILGLAEAYRSDTRAGKINLSSGVFVDESGTTPVLATVIEAERRLADAAGTKLYRPIDGEVAYRELVRALVLGADHEAVVSGRALATQTPGGTGGPARGRRPPAADGLRPDAVDERADVAEPPAAVPRRRLPGAAVSVHGRDRARDRFRGAAVRARGRLAGRRRAPPRRVPQPDGRGSVARAVAADRGCRGGAAAAAAGRPRLPGVRRRAARGRGGPARARAAGRGAAGVDVVLEDVLAVRGAGRRARGHRVVVGRRGGRPEPRQGGDPDELLQPAGPRRGHRAHDPRRRGRCGPRWEAELAAMRDRIKANRRALVAALEARSIPGDWSGIATQRGMFALLGLSADQVARLRDEHARRTSSATAGSTSPGSRRRTSSPSPTRSPRCSPRPRASRPAPRGRGRSSPRSAPARARPRCRSSDSSASRGSAG